MLVKFLFPNSIYHFSLPIVRILKNSPFSFSDITRSAPHVSVCQCVVVVWVCSLLSTYHYWHQSTRTPYALLRHYKTRRLYRVLHQMILQSLFKKKSFMYFDSTIKILKITRFPPQYIVWNWSLQIMLKDILGGGFVEFKLRFFKIALMLVFVS